MVIVGVKVSGPAKRTADVGPQTAHKEAEGVSPASTPASLPASFPSETAGNVASLVLPVVRVTANDYTPEALRATFEKLPVRREFAQRYTMSDAVNLCESFKRKAGEDFTALGQDGAVLEAMITYTEQGEPILLPCYMEKAKYQGQPVWIIGLAAPLRSGKSVNLTRMDVWVMNPDKFVENPDSGVVAFWGINSNPQ